MLMVMRWNSLERRADEVEEVTVKIGGGEVVESLTGMESMATGAVDVDEMVVGVGSAVEFVIEQRGEKKNLD